MYVMKLLTPDHVSALDKLLALRMSWLAESGLPRSGETSNLMELVRLPEPEPGMLPEGIWDGESLVAAFAVQDAALTAGWTVDERQEPSLVLSLALPDPRNSSLGEIAVHWLCDYAARGPVPLAWIRCTVRPRTLADHLRWDCGWAAVREVSSLHRDSCHLLQQPPQLDEHIELLVRTEGGLA